MMTIYMYLSDNDHDDIVSSIEPSINDWLFQNNIDAEFINQKVDHAEEKIADQSRTWKLGLNIKKDQMDWMPQILSFLHSTAMLHQKDFIVGLCNEPNPIGEFGFSRGKDQVDQILKSLTSK